MSSVAHSASSGLALGALDDKKKDSIWLSFLVCGGGDKMDCRSKSKADRVLSSPQPLRHGFHNCGCKKQRSSLHSAAKKGGRAELSCPLCHRLLISACAMDEVLFKISHWGTVFLAHS